MGNAFPIQERSPLFTINHYGWSIISTDQTEGRWTRRTVAFEEENSAIGTGRLLSETWERCVKPGAPGPLSLEALVALMMLALGVCPSPIPLRQ